MIDAAVIEPLNRGWTYHRRRLQATRALGPRALAAVEPALSVRAA